MIRLTVGWSRRRWSDRVRRGSAHVVGPTKRHIELVPQQIEPVAKHRRYNQVEMPAANSRDQMIEALRELPPDATVDDAIERLVFLAKIEAGLAELDRGEGIPHDEVKRRLGL